MVALTGLLPLRSLEKLLGERGGGTSYVLWRQHVPETAVLDMMGIIRIYYRGVCVCVCVFCCCWFKLSVVDCALLNFCLEIYLITTPPPKCITAVFVT